MKGLGALQRHQLPHPLAKILDPPLVCTVQRAGDGVHVPRPRGRNSRSGSRQHVGR